MKLCKVIIKDFQQFKHLELDFTYPEGHDKAGEPLEKVCFIGRNGTGKTTLLNLIFQLLKGGYVSDTSGHILFKLKIGNEFVYMVYAFLPRNIGSSQYFYSEKV